MTYQAIVRLAQIAHDYDLAGEPQKADVIENAMMRLSQSATQKWWEGVKHIGTGLLDDAKAAGNAIAAPFEGMGAAANAAWNTGLKNAPAAAGQAAGQALGRAGEYTQQEMQQYQQAAPAVAGPGGTGLAGAVVQDAAHGVGQAVNNAAQGFVRSVLDQREQAKQQSNMAQWLQQAIQRHRADGHGWDVINSAVQYGQLSPDNQAKLRQEFAQAATQSGPR